MNDTDREKLYMYSDRGADVLLDKVHIIGSSAERRGRLRRERENGKATCVTVKAPASSEKPMQGH